MVRWWDGCGVGELMLSNVFFKVRWVVYVLKWEVFEYELYFFFYYCLFVVVIFYYFGILLKSFLRDFMCDCEYFLEFMLFCLIVMSIFFGLVGVLVWVWLVLWWLFYFKYSVKVGVIFELFYIFVEKMLDKFFYVII